MQDQSTAKGRLSPRSWMVGWREHWVEGMDRKMLDTPKGIRACSYGAEETKTSRDGRMEEWREEGG